MVMMAAAGSIFAMMVMNLLTSISGKDKHIHRMVYGAFVEPEPRKCRHIDQQDKGCCYFAGKFHGPILHL